MGKKNEKKLCWNCDGNVSLHLSICPYCGVDLNKNEEDREPSLKRKTPFAQTDKFSKGFNEAIPKPPYASPPFANDVTVTDDEWKKALEDPSQEKESQTSSKNDLMALLLLLPGIVFFLFGLILVLFSNNGVLSLKWNEHFAYFYFAGSLPLIILGWKALK